MFELVMSLIAVAALLMLIGLVIKFTVGAVLEEFPHAACVCHECGRCSLEAEPDECPSNYTQSHYHVGKSS